MVDEESQFLAKHYYSKVTTGEGDNLLLGYTMIAHKDSGTIVYIGKGDGRIVSVNRNATLDDIKEYINRDNMMTVDTLIVCEISTTIPNHIGLL